MCEFQSDEKQPAAAQADLVLSTLVCRPVAKYMDQVSLVETCRQRVMLKARGLKLQKSKCDKTVEDVRKMNFDIFSGACAMSVLKEYTRYLIATADDDLWMPWLSEECRPDWTRCCKSIVCVMSDSTLVCARVLLVFMIH